MSVYEKAEAFIRERLGKRRILENCVKLGLYLARKHGPHLRVFAIPSEALAGDEAFAGRVGLSRSQIRTATEALIEVGFINRISPERTERRYKDRPVRYELGDEIAALFPAACEIASCKTQGFIILAPLKEATSRASFGPKSPDEPPAPYQPGSSRVLQQPSAVDHEKSLAQSRLASLKGLPVPRPSQAALMAGRLGQFREARRL